MVEWRLHPSAGTLQAVLDLPARWPRNQDASLAAATALASEGRFSDALGQLGEPKAWTRLPANGRLLVARSLQSLGRPAEALSVVDDLPNLTAGGAILRAQVIAAVRGTESANAAFRAVAAGSDATPDVYLSWSAISSSEGDRLSVLNAGSQRFPSNVPILTALASAEWAQRHRAAATAATKQTSRLQTSKILKHFSSAATLSCPAIGRHSCETNPLYPVSAITFARKR